MIFHKLLRKVIYMRLKRKLGSPAGAAMLSADYAAEYGDRKFSLPLVIKAHRRGFSANDWKIMGVGDDCCADYLSTEDYFSMHPFNGRYTDWIDDKLTLKYLCSGTDLDRYMPKYYYQTDSHGNFLRLMDAPAGSDSSAESVADLLEVMHALALKRISGSIGEGFYKAEFRNGKYYIGDTEYDREGFCTRIRRLTDYIFTEYLRPCDELAEFSPDTVNCIRVLVGRIDNRLVPITSFIRLGTSESKFVENYNAGGILCYIDDNGKFTSGNILDKSTLTNIHVTSMPETGKELIGTIPMWDDIQTAVRLFGEHFPQLRYMGFDFAVTYERCVKILEINSLTSLDTMQLEKPILHTAAGEFFKSQIGSKRN